jgi:hypothetical protein
MACCIAICSASAQGSWPARLQCRPILLNSLQIVMEGLLRHSIQQGELCLVSNSHHRGRFSRASFKRCDFCAFSPSFALSDCRLEVDLLVRPMFASEIVWFKLLEDEVIDGSGRISVCDRLDCVRFVSVSQIVSSCCGRVAAKIAHITLVLEPAGASFVQNGRNLVPHGTGARQGEKSKIFCARAKKFRTFSLFHCRRHISLSSVVFVVFGGVTRSRPHLWPRDG